jgi:hypothetical protein
MKPLPWSFSALNSFKTCPHQFAEVKVYKRFEEEQGEAAAWGNFLHKELEKWVAAGITPHENVRPYMEHVQQAIMWMGGIVSRNSQTDSVLTFAEYRMSLNAKLRPCDWNAVDVWLRGIADVLKINGNEAWVIDWKTGKVKPDSRQLRLFAVLVFYHFPKVINCHVSFEWLQFGKNTRETINIMDVPSIWQEFLPDLLQYREAFKTETWQKRPSGLCKNYCPVHSCSHNGYFQKVVA